MNLVSFAAFFSGSILVLAGIPFADTPTTGIINLLQILDLFLVNLLLTFGLQNLIYKKLNDSVIEEKMHFEYIFNTTPDAVAISRLSDGMYIDCNPGFKTVSGYNREEIIGKTSGELNIWKNPEDRNELASIIREKGVHDGFETTFIRKDGKIITGFLSAKIIYINNEPHLLTLTRDITSRKEAEETLRTSEQQLELIINTAQEAIVVLADRKLVFFNPRMVEITGYTEEELRGLDVIKLVHPDDAETLATNYRLRLSGGSAPKRYPVRLIRKNGEIHWLELGGVKIDWLGKPATLTFIIDITDRMLAELEVIAAKNKLEKLNSEKDRFFSIIAHDLKSPFLGLLGFTEILAEGSEKFTALELKQIGDDLHRTASNLYKLLKNLLEWAQMQQGLLSFKPEQLALDKLIAESIETLQKRSEQKGIHIINNVTEPVQVSADERMLNSVLLNLLSNAVKFTYRDGTVTVSVKRVPPNFFEVSVQDTGIGMQQTDVDRLFQLDAKVRSIGTEGELSTGLGLLLCKDFVERHGGKIRVESEQAKGSTFHFTLPEAL